MLQVKSTNYILNSINATKSKVVYYLECWRIFGNHGRQKWIFIGIPLIQEASMANIGIVNKDNELIIPPFTKTLAGTTSKAVIQLFEKGDIPSHILKAIRHDVLLTTEAKNIAKEVIIMGGGAIVPVLQWDDKIISNTPGIVCKYLQSHIGK